MNQNKVFLKVNRKYFGGWTDVSISAGIERLARDFNVTITRQWPSSGDNSETNIDVKNGDLVEVFIDDDVVLTGYVEALPIRYDAGALSMGIIGRSKTADCVDCSAVPKQYNGSSTVQVIQDLVKPFKLNVNNQGNDAGSLSVQADQGDTVFDVISKIMGMQQIVVFDDEHGQVVIGDIGSDEAKTALVLGANILSADTEKSIKDRYSDYFVSGQSVSDDQNFGEATLASIKSSSKDDGILRYRPLIIKQSGDSNNGTCQERCEMEKTLRASKTREVTYTVQGWRQGDGTLWKPNQMVVVDDPLLGYDNEKLVIAEVKYSLSRRGTLCELKVGPIEAYLPDKKKIQKKGGKGEKSSTGEVF